MDGMELIIDFFKDLHRLGPGDDAQSQKALEAAGPGNTPVTIADIGCGTGAQTLFLARETKADIIAVDFLQPFLDTLRERARASGLPVKTLCAAMDNLPFDVRSFDMLWSEGAIYNIGFENGIRYWKQFIKPHGYLAITEMSWLTDERPEAVSDYWNTMYGGIDTVACKTRQLQNAGYTVTAHFTLPAYCWDNYYEPMRRKEQPFLEKWNYHRAAVDFINEGITEREMFDRYNKYYGYEFYIARNE